jgi:hypothetical protein
MLALISSIPKNVREGFDVQDLPHRASTLSEEQMSKLFGGACSPRGAKCTFDRDCCKRAPDCVGLNPFSRTCRTGKWG